MGVSALSRVMSHPQLPVRSRQYMTLRPGLRPRTMSTSGLSASYEEDKEPQAHVLGSDDASMATELHASTPAAHEAAEPLHKFLDGVHGTVKLWWDDPALLLINLVLNFVTKLWRSANELGASVTLLLIGVVYKASGSAPPELREMPDEKPILRGFFSCLAEVVLQGMPVTAPALVAHFIKTGIISGVAKVLQAWTTSLVTAHGIVPHNLYLAALLMGTFVLMILTGGWLMGVGLVGLVNAAMVGKEMR